MKTTEVITLKKHTYDGKTRETGDVYPAEDRHLPVIMGLGWAKLHEVQAKRNEYLRRDMRPQK